MITLKEESLIVGGVDRKIDKIAEKVFELLNERLSEAVGQYGCDLHNYLFNEEQAFIYHHTAEDACERVGVFSAIRLVKKYEEDQFGESNTKIEPCDVANMLVYIYGEYLLQASDAVDEKQWDREMTAKDGTRLVVLPEWCGAPAKDVMRQVYIDIEEIIRAIRIENVEI
jgi:hypothetical protein|nr:MAG TPA: hypothetical protein [Caudoviricetes sp.]